jgi:tetratricopeptide (TPR) repeat protein
VRLDPALPPALCWAVELLGLDSKRTSGSPNPPRTLRHIFQQRSTDERRENTPSPLKATARAVVAGSMARRRPFRLALLLLAAVAAGGGDAGGGSERECETFRECVGLAALHSASDAAAAARMYERATELRPDSKEAWLGRGALAQEAGHLDAASSHLVRAMMLDPECWRAGMNVGNLAARRGDLPTALRAFQHVIRTNPFVPQAFYARGFVQLLQGRLKPACASFQRAWELKPDFHTMAEFRFALDGLQSLRSAMVASLGEDSPDIPPCPVGHLDTDKMEPVHVDQISSVWEDSYMQGKGRAECEASSIDIATFWWSVGDDASWHTSMDVARSFVGRIHALYGPDCADFVTVHLLLPEDALEPHHLAEMQLWDLVKVHNVTRRVSAGRAGERATAKGGRGQEQVEWAGEEGLRVIRDMQATAVLPRELVVVDIRAMLSSRAGRSALQVDA